MPDTPCSFYLLLDVRACRSRALLLLLLLVIVLCAPLARTSTSIDASGAGEPRSSLCVNITDAIVQGQQWKRKNSMNPERVWSFSQNASSSRPRSSSCSLQGLVGEQLVLNFLDARRARQLQPSRQYTDTLETHQQHSSSQEAVQGENRKKERPLSLLFVGDSSVRNAALSLVLSICNPFGNFRKCDPAIVLPFLSSETSKKDDSSKPPNAFHCPPLHSNYTNTCGEMRHSFTSLKNITSAAFYQSREERAVRWKAKEVVPLLTLNYRDQVEVHILEAGCSSRTDGLWRMLDFAIESTKAADNASSSSSSSKKVGGYLMATDGGFVPFDALVLSGGLHCSYKVYRGGNWYRSLFTRIPSLKQEARVPVVWLEVTHCLKGDGGHFYKQGSKFLLNYRKVAACGYIDQHIPTMNNLVEMAGAVIAPTRHITRNLSGGVPAPSSVSSEHLVSSPSCAFVDLMHPDVVCYLAIAQSLIHTLLWTLYPPRHHHQQQEDHIFPAHTTVDQQEGLQVVAVPVSAPALVRDGDELALADQWLVVEVAALVVALLAVCAWRRHQKCLRRAVL